MRGKEKVSQTPVFITLGFLTVDTNMTSYLSPFCYKVSSVVHCALNVYPKYTFLSFSIFYFPRTFYHSNGEKITNSRAGTMTQKLHALVTHLEDPVWFVPSHTAALYHL